ncbi:MAG: OmpA family protein [bacterium]|nr:OmpA family protein [bacterium]
MRLLLLISILSVQIVQIAHADCQRAARLAADAYDLGTDERTFAQQKQWLHQALSLCPNQADAHNLLADILEREGTIPAAIEHYRLAIAAEPDFDEAWYGLGESYSRQQRFALALEAYLQACPRDLDARVRVIELLEGQRFRVTPDGAILDKQSLLLLFDPARRQGLQRALQRCRFKAEVQPVFVFTNIHFDTGESTLQSRSREQIEAIGEALLEADETAILISGHTDRQGFRGKTEQQSLALNQLLSERRADQVGKRLAAIGVDHTRLETRGYGASRPVEAGKRRSRENRRVEIEVVEE